MLLVKARSQEIIAVQYIVGYSFNSIQLAPRAGGQRRFTAIFESLPFR